MKKSSVLAAPTVSGGRPETRASLLDAMEALLGRKGFAGCTSTAVATEAGLSAGTFYGYFADRNAALAALFAERLDAIMTEVEQSLTADRLLDEGLRGALSAAVAATVAGYGRHAGVLRAALAAVQTDAQIRDVYWDRHRRSADLVERFLRRAAAAGLVRSDGHAALAQTVLLLLQALNSPVVLAGPNQRVVAGIRRNVVDALEAVLAPRTST